MDPILYDFGIIRIYWYSFFIFLGLFIGGYLVLRESRKFGVAENFMINLFFYLIPISLIGARIYYVAFNWIYFKDDLLSIVKVWEGGLAIHGGILFGLLWIIFYTKKYKTRTLLILDFTVVGLIIGQAIGRWGNFFNSEAYGGVVSLSFLNKWKIPEFIIDGMYIGGQYHHPTFLYESLWCLLGFIVILIYKHYKYVKIGQITSFYLIWYGIGRYFIEGLRTDSLMFMDYKMAQVTSVGMVIVGFIMIIVLNRGSKFKNQYNETVNLNDMKNPAVSINDVISETRV